MIGHVIDGYTIERELGNGVIGKSFLASKQNGTSGDDLAKVVLKIPDEISYLPSINEVLENLRDLAPPQTLLYLKVKMGEDRVPFLLVEHVEGESLANRLAREEKLPEDEAFFIFQQILHDLIPLHQGKFSHGSLRPENIILSQDSRVYLSDVGLADVVREINEEAFFVYVYGKVIGRKVIQPYRYFSPSRMRAEVATPKDDIFSLGVILYQMFTGEVPADNAPSQFCGRLDMAMEKILMQMVGDVSRRYPDGSELLSALESIEDSLSFSLLSSCAQGNGSSLPGLEPPRHGEGMATTKLHLSPPMSGFNETTKLNIPSDPDFALFDIEESPDVIDDEEVEDSLEPMDLGADLLSPELGDFEAMGEELDSSLLEDMDLMEPMMEPETGELEPLLSAGEIESEGEYSSDILDSDILGAPLEGGDMSSALMESVHPQNPSQDNPANPQLLLPEEDMLSEDTDLLKALDRPADLDDDLLQSALDMVDPGLDLGITDDIVLEEFEYPSDGDLDELLPEPGQPQNDFEMDDFGSGGDFDLSQNLSQDLDGPLSLPMDDDFADDQDSFLPEDLSADLDSPLSLPLGDELSDSFLSQDLPQDLPQDLDDSFFSPVEESDPEALSPEEALAMLNMISGGSSKKKKKKSTVIPPASASPPPPSPPSLEEFAGNCSLLVTGLSSVRKKEKAAEIIAQIRGISLEDALEMTENPFVKVLRDVSEERAEEGMNLLKNAHIAAKITRRKV